MTRADWNQYLNADSNNVLSTDREYEGVSSLKVTDPSLDSAEIFAASEADKPTECRVETEVYISDNDASGPIVFSRFIDAENFHFAGISNNNNDGGVHFHFRIVDAGGNDLIGLDVLGSSFSSLDAQLSDGTTNVVDRWVPWRVDMWFDSSGDFRARLYEDADRDGNWTQYGNDLVDTNPAAADGGGVGIGVMNNQDAFPIYFDQTEVYY